MKINIKHIPELDAEFCPAALWDMEFRRRVDASLDRIPLSIALAHDQDNASVFKTSILPHTAQTVEFNRKYVERLIKFLLWQKGSCIILISDRQTADIIAKIYSPDGERSFDYNFMGKKVYGQPMQIEYRPEEEMPLSGERANKLGRHLDGCRIGFDLGGSDRKCAALIDSKVVFSEEIKWDPYFQKDPSYHIQGINDSLKRAAEHLPQVDAIGGSAAGIYVNNEVRVASLFRGVSEEDFNNQVRHIFSELKKLWGNIPFEVINDGEVTALAGSMSMRDNAVLGISMGTSLAAGYVTPEGNMTQWLNELAFVPVDYRDDGPADEWSGDVGCGVQYFSQQAVARLAPIARIELAEEIPLPERLVKVQTLMKSGDERAASIFNTIGIYFGYTIAHYSDFYDFRNLLILGRVTSGEGGKIIIEKAEEVLADEFPELHDKIELRTPSEKDKRHGQAIAAASLPELS